MPQPTAHGFRRERTAGLLTVGALVAVLCVPWLRAWRAPPPGRAFAGSFVYQDDYAQYLSFAEQAARGRWLFVNKFDPRPQEAFLFNAGWWIAGRTAGLLRWPLPVAWFAWSLAASALLVLGTRRLLGCCGALGAARAWGTVLVLTGGGLGWLQTVLATPSLPAADLRFGFFPWLQLLAGAHGTLGSALLVWALALHTEWRDRAAPRWAWVTVATLLGLSRPFDLAVFLAVVAAVSAIEGPRGSWRDLAWLAPVLFYDALAYGVHPSFSSWSGPQNRVPIPGPVALAWALGPAAVLAAFSLARTAPQRRQRLLQTVWIAVAAGLLFSGLGFASQLASSLGLALLVAIVAGLPRGWLPAAAVASCPTAIVLFWGVTWPAPEVFPPEDYLAATRVLASECAPGDVLYGPSDPSLLVAALTPCHTVFGHRVLTPQFEQRAAESRVFYKEATTSSWRGAYLEGLRARFAMVPASREPWLAGTRFLPRWRFGPFEVWQRRQVEPPSPAFDERSVARR